MIGAIYNHANLLHYRALLRESEKEFKGQCGNLDPGMMNEGGKWQAVIPDPLTAVTSFHRSTENFFDQVDQKLNFMHDV